MKHKEQLLSSQVQRQIEQKIELETYNTREESHGYRNCYRQRYSTNTEMGKYSQIENVGYGNKDALYSHDHYSCSYILAIILQLQLYIAKVIQPQFESSKGSKKERQVLCEAKREIVTNIDRETARTGDRARYVRL